jgi:hypothetical protein
VTGFLLGELVAWINSRAHRRRARQATRRVEELERAAAKPPAKDAAKEIARN